MSMNALSRWVSGLILIPRLVHSADWPQYRGPNHDGVSAELIRTNWMADPPRQLWKITALNGGFSSFTVSGGRAFTLDQRDVNGTMREICIALDADTGQELWAAEVGNAAYDGGTGSIDGPRSTPSLDGDRVYVLSAYLSLSCLNVTNGAVIWSKDLLTQYGGQNIGWESAASPLIEGDLIFANCNGPGHRLVALHKMDGSEAWKGTDFGLTHSTPVAATIQGTRQIIFYTSSGLVSVVPETGSVLWRYATPACPYSSTSTAMSPAVGDNTIFCAAAYSVGGAAVGVTTNGTSWVATERWPKKSNLQCHWATPVYRGGYYYGIFGSYSSTLPLRCMEAATGNVLWSQSGFGSGGVLLLGPYLLVLAVSGDVVLVDPSPSGYRELARLAHVINGDCWNVPSVSGGRIYARSTTEAVSLDVSVSVPVQPLTIETALGSGSGGLRLQIRNADGSSIDASRVANIGVLASTNLTVAGGGWSGVTNLLQFTNGMVYLDDSAPTSRPQRFYRTLEQH